MNLVHNISPVKSKSEQQALRKASALSTQLHRFAMIQKCEGQTELALVARLNEFKGTLAVEEWAYNPLLSSGARSTEVHAYPSSHLVARDELILIDAGLKVDGWCSDITRTWPAGKKFNNKQKNVYRIVLRAQKEVISRIRPGQTLSDLNQVAQDYLREGLLSADIINDGDISKLFPHKTSHWIGREVHDPCSYLDELGNPLKLNEGMIFTVEPGLYFTDPGHSYYGIAVRIEDVVMVNDKTCEVLSSVPKEIEDIEELRNQAYF